METTVMQLPFSGFYESLWSSALDSEEEYTAEAMSEAQAEDGIPEEFRLTASEIAEAMFYAMDYRAAHLNIARQYVEAFNDWAEDETGLDLGLTFESMSSPRFYNFETDRIFATVPLATVRELFRQSAEESHARLAEILVERHTSRSGFHSFYSNDLEDWTEKPVEEWDHNELASLWLAVVGEPDDCTLYERVDFYSAFDAGMDWSALEERLSERRAGKEAEWREDNPEADMPEAPYRCSVTPDLFQSAR